MKKLISSLLLLITVALTLSAAEEKKLYKWVDKQGNLHFSDQPIKGGQEIEMKLTPATKIVKVQPLTIPSTTNNQQQSQDYDVVRLSEPLDSGIVRNNASLVTLTASLQPSLQASHNIRFFLDGALISGETGAVSVEATGISYGNHSANFIVVNAQGKLIQSSETVHFQLLNRINPKIRKQQKANRPH